MYKIIIMVMVVNDDYTIGKGRQLLTSLLVATVVLWLVGWWPVMIFSTFNLCPKSVNVVSLSIDFRLTLGEWPGRTGVEQARRYWRKYQDNNETTILI